MQASPSDLRIVGKSSDTNKLTAPKRSQVLPRIYTSCFQKRAGRAAPWQRRRKWDIILIVKRAFHTDLLSCGQPRIITSLRLLFSVICDIRIRFFLQDIKNINLFNYSSISQRSFDDIVAIPAYSPPPNFVRSLIIALYYSRQWGIVLSDIFITIFRWNLNELNILRIKNKNKKKIKRWRQDIKVHGVSGKHRNSSLFYFVFLFFSPYH